LCGKPGWSAKTFHSLLESLRFKLSSSPRSPFPLPLVLPPILSCIPQASQDTRDGVGKVSLHETKIQRAGSQNESQSDHAFHTTSCVTSLIALADSACLGLLLLESLEECFRNPRHLDIYPPLKAAKGAKVIVVDNPYPFPVSDR